MDMLDFSELDKAAEPLISSFPSLVSFIAELLTVVRERDDAVEAANSYLELLNEERELRFAAEAKLERANSTFGEAFLGNRKNKHKLSHNEAQAIRRWKRVAPHVSNKSIAHYYGVHPTTVARILAGTYYREEQ